MRKTTVYLPDDLKFALEHKARSEKRTEAAIIREAIAAATTAYRNPRKPRLGYSHAGEEIASRVDEVLAEGFGSL